MGKLELVIMAGAESKAFLAGLTAQLDRAEGLIEQLSGLQTEAPAPKTTKAAATTKQADKVKKAAEPEVEPTDDIPSDDSSDLDFLDEEVQDAVKEPDVADVRKAMKDFANKHGKEKTLKFLGKFKATAIPELNKKDYAKVIELAQKHS